MTGEERHWLYRIALETALRSGEIRTLTRESFLLDGTEPSVYLPGDDTKNRLDAEIPIRPDTAIEIVHFLDDRPEDAMVFPMPHPADVVKMLRRDLEAARKVWINEAKTVQERVDREQGSFCAAVDDAGRVLDFHGLRVTSISWLAATDAPVKDLQTFARHSDPKLTMNTYATTLHGSQSRLVSMLPDLSEDQPDRNRDRSIKTGTDDRPISDCPGPKTGKSTGGKGVLFGTSEFSSVPGKETRDNIVSNRGTSCIAGNNDEPKGIKENAPGRTRTCDLRLRKPLHETTTPARGDSYRRGRGCPRL